MLNLKSFEDYVNEKFWRDIDNVDILDNAEFVKYLCDRYGYDFDIRYKKYESDAIYMYKDIINFTIPIKEHPRKKVEWSLIEFDTEKKIVFIWDTFKNDLPNTYEKLNDNFKLETYTDRIIHSPGWETCGTIKICPKDNRDVSNSFFIDVIEFLLAYNKK